MNLHDVRFRLTNIAVWAESIGRRGRGIGNHLWVVDEGNPPQMEPMPRWQSRSYWTPSRFGWRPFNDSLMELFRNGYVRPLCGRNSAARHPSLYVASYPGGCDRCAAIATERGIISMTQSEAMQQSSIYQALNQEREAWRAAGRPDEWPQPAT